MQGGKEGKEGRGRGKGKRGGREKGRKGGKEGPICNFQCLKRTTLEIIVVFLSDICLYI